MRIIKDKGVDTGDVLFSLNRSNPIAVQVLSGLPNEDNTTINSNEPNFFRYLSALSQDAQALPKLRYQAGQLVFYYYDKPQFMRLLHSYTQETGATGDFWYNVVNRFMLSDGSLNGFSEWANGIFGGLKAWNVDRGAKLIEKRQAELDAAKASGDSKAIAKAQAKLDDQITRQHRREANFQNTVAKTSEEKRNQIMGKWGFNDSYFQNHNKQYQELQTKRNNTNYFNPLAQQGWARGQYSTLADRPKNKPDSDNQKSDNQNGNQSAGSTIDYGNLASGLLNATGMITSAILQNKAAQNQSPPSALVPSPAYNPSPAPSANPLVPSLSTLANIANIPSIPSTGNQILDSALTNATRVAQASVPLLAPSTVTHPPVATTPPQTQPLPTMPSSTVKAGFNTKKMMMIGGGVVALGALFFLINKSKAKTAGLAGLDSETPVPTGKYKILPVI